MKTAFVGLLIFAAIVCFAIGFLCASDPNGRGGTYLLKFWSAAALCGFLAIGVHWGLP